VPDESLPLKPPDDRPEKSRPTLAPAWLALLTSWLGLFMLVAAIVFTLLPGSRDPVAELQHARPFSLQDRFLPIPIYGIALVLFLGIVILWQMRKEPRPLPEELVYQRIQAWTGIVLSLIGAAVVYGYVALHGPK
jgi:hypothetical protein